MAVNKILRIYMNFSDITEQYLDKVYDDFHKEQMSLLQDIKTGCERVKEKDNQKQFTILNNLMINVLRLRNIRKQIKSRID
jgi:hypothetical protein